MMSLRMMMSLSPVMMQLSDRTPDEENFLKNHNKTHWNRSELNER